jgi:hypothetical protein
VLALDPLVEGGDLLGRQVPAVEVQRLHEQERIAGGVDELRRDPQFQADFNAMAAVEDLVLVEHGRD